MTSDFAGGGGGWRRWVVRRGYLHVILLTGTAIFVFPFLWMVLTSLKTDEEIVSTSWMPAIPSFRGTSPYVRPDAVPTRPEDVTRARWQEMLPGLRARAAAVITAALPAVSAVQPQVWTAAARDLLVGRIAAQLPDQLWKGADAPLLQTFGTLATPMAARAALDDRLARLAFTGLEFRTLDSRIAVLASGAQIASAWHVRSGHGQLSAVDGAATLSYRFVGSSDAPIVIDAPFQLPSGFAPADLHILILSFRADDSWHRIDVSLDLGGHLWRSTRTSWAAQNRVTSIDFQPPTYDDSTDKARTWVPLVDTGPDAGAARVQGAGAGLLRITITPSSTLTAIMGKIERNYARAFESVPFWTYVGNSLVLVVLTMLGSLFSSALVAYAFARLDWPGRSVAMIVLLATMMLPSQVTMIPSFLIWRSLGWYNTLNPLWVPAWFGSAFFIFLMVQQMKTIPKELEEAARMDGFSAIQTWWYVIVPQVKPTLAGIAILTFMGSWNDFMGPLIYLRDQDRFPLSLGLFGTAIGNSPDWAVVMAGNIIMTLPVILIFFLCQRYFVEGMTMTGIKG